MITITRCWLSQTVSIDVTIRPTVAGNPRNNTASVVFAGLVQPTLLTPIHRNSATVGVEVLDSVDLFVTKTDAPDPVKSWYRFNLCDYGR